MNASRLDSFAKALASRRSRRSTLLGGAGLLAAGREREASARVAIPATPQASPAAKAKGGSDPTFMFVQSFTSGTLTPRSDDSDTYILNLENGLGETIYFSDRPDRIFGTISTDTFLKNFPFTEHNPPNASLVLQGGPDDTDVVVLELTSPAYDVSTHSATYDVSILSDYEKLGITFQKRPAGPDQVHTEFTEATLFIDDCPDLVSCLAPTGFDASCELASAISIGAIPGGPYGQCWHWSELRCVPCSESLQTLNELCNQTYGNRCNTGHADPSCTDGQCVAG